MKDRNKVYHDCTDEKLIMFARSGDDQAMDFLMEKYKNMVKGKAKTLYLIGGDHDDLIQEGMIGLYKAIRDYKEEKDAAFSSFAMLCVSRQMYHAIEAQNRKKNLPLNNYISFYTPVYGEDKEEAEATNLVDTMYQDKDSDPEKFVIDKESVNVLEYNLLSRLSSLERRVLRLYLDGMGYQEIADMLGREPKSVDNALQRIKAKLNQILETTQ